MNVGPLNAIAGAAGSHLAQTRGADADRTSEETRQSDAKSMLNGRGAADATIDENQQTEDRDGDGRSVIVVERRDGESEEDGDESPDNPSGGAARDPSGERGNRLDISG